MGFRLLPPGANLDDDPDAAGLRQTFGRILLMMFGIVAVGVGVQILRLDAIGPNFWRLVSALLAHSLSLGPFWLIARQGKPRAALFCYLAYAITLANAVPAFANGVYAPGIALQLAPLAAGCILMGRKATLALFFLAVGETTLLYLLGSHGMLPPSVAADGIDRRFVSALFNICYLTGFCVPCADHIRSLRSVQKESSDGFEASFERSPMAQIVLALDPATPGGLCAARSNPAFSRMAGSEEAANGLAALALGNDPARVEQIAQACRAGASLDGIEVGFADRHGRRRELVLSLSPIAWRGAPASLCALVDRTDAADLERELRQANADLESRALERAAELDAAHRELRDQERLASLGSMVAGVAHELNTPIGNARLIASTLGESAAALRQRVEDGELRRSDLTHHFERASEAGELLSQSLERAAQLISQFKQISADRSSSARRSFSLLGLARDILAIHGAALGAHPIPIQATAMGGGGPDPVIDSYPGPLGQVLSNLLNNSLLHAFEGRESGAIDILVWLDSASGMACLRYSDDGSGMASGSLARVFDPFYTTKLGQGGTGLGMYIAHNIVCDLLGGSIKAESPRGSGAVFTLRLPLSAPATAQPEGDDHIRSFGAGS